MSTGVGTVPTNDPEYDRFDIPARWTDEFPLGTRRPARPTHRGLAIRAERRTFRQQVRALCPRLSFRR
jgi:hypothetical protein